MTLSESCYQAILTYLELISNSINTFQTQSYYQTIVNTFLRFEWTLEQTKNSHTENSQLKVLTYTHETDNFAIK